MLSALILLAATQSSDYRTRYPLPSEGSLDGWGVNIHFTAPAPGEVVKIRAAGFKWVRMDFIWNSIEREKGRYDFAAYHRLLDALDKEKMRPIFILDYGNDLYQQGSPRSPEAIAGFVRFVKASVREFGGRGIVWEMWNEPNITFWKPRPNAQEYITLADATGKALRETAPEEWFVGPATSTFDWAFLQKCFEAGLLRYWDAVTVHPYRQEEPETAIEDWYRLRRMIDAAAPPQKKIEMISGEWGYSDAWGGMNRQKQGAFVPRQYLTNLISGVGLSIYYDWKDDGPEPKDPEHHFGTTTQDTTPKPSYLAAQTLTRQLEGYSYRFRMDDGDPRHYTLVFTKGDDVRFVVWTAGAPGRTQLPLDGAESPEAWWQDRREKVLDSNAILAAEPKVVTVAGETPTLRKISRVAPIPQEVVMDRVSPIHSKGAINAKVAMEGGELFSRYSEQPTFATYTIDLSSDHGTVKVVQRVRVIPSQPLFVDPVPAFGNEPARAVLRNPSGKPLSAELKVGAMPPIPVQLQEGQHEVEIRLPFGTKNPFGSPMSLVIGSARHDLPGRLATKLAEPKPGETIGQAGFEVVAEGDEKVRATVSGSVVPAARGLNASAARMRYDFAPGWRYVCLKPTGRGSDPLPGKPEAFSLYVHGDGSGDLLRMRFQDATGQTFQPDAGPIDWKGWRWIRFRLDGKSTGRWGGANDGVVHYPIHIETAALVDSAGGRGGTGDVQFAGFTVIGGRW